MDEASTQEDIDAILDVPEYLEVINGSGWLCIQTVAISNINEIVQGLIAEEVIRKRMKSMDDLRKGLSIVGILPLMGSYPAQLKKFFVDGDNAITAEEFKRQFSKECVMPTEYPACQVYEWYMEYITEGEKTSEGLLTVFFRSLFNACNYQICCGSSQIWQVGKLAIC